MVCFNITCGTEKRQAGEGAPGLSDATTFPILSKGTRAQGSIKQRRWLYRQRYLAERQGGLSRKPREGRECVRFTEGF